LRGLLLRGGTGKKGEGRRGEEREGGCYGDGVKRRKKGLTEEERDGEGMEGDNGIGPPIFPNVLAPRRHN